MRDAARIADRFSNAKHVAIALAKCTKHHFFNWLKYPDGIRPDSGAIVHPQFTALAVLPGTRRPLEICENESQASRGPCP